MAYATQINLLGSTLLFKVWTSKLLLAKSVDPDQTVQIHRLIVLFGDPHVFLFGFYDELEILMRMKMLLNFCDVKCM